MRTKHTFLVIVFCFLADIPDLPEMTDLEADDNSDVTNRDPQPLNLR